MTQFRTYLKKVMLIWGFVSTVLVAAVPWISFSGIHKLPWTHHHDAPQLNTTGSPTVSSFSTKLESSAVEEPGRQTVINASFAFTSLYTAEQRTFTTVLISQRIESTTRSGVEGADSHLEATAWITGRRSYDTKLWVIKDSADRGEEWGDFYRTTKYGCCGAENIYRAFNLRTGTHVFSFSAEPVFIDVPNTTIKRSISYISANAADDGPTPSKAIGLLTLSSNEAQIDRILIESDDRELAFSPQVSALDGKEAKGASRLSLWPSSGENKPEAVRGFSAKLSFYDGMEAVIPVSEDRFALQNATLPKTIKIRRISPGKRK